MCVCLVTAVLWQGHIVTTNQLRLQGRNRMTLTWMHMHIPLETKNVNLHATVLCSCSVLPEEIVSAKVQKPGRDGTRKKTTSTFLRNDCGKEGQGDCPISAVCFHPHSVVV